MGNEREAIVFVFNGLLESGKTVMINRFFDNPQIRDGKNILLIVCEEGIEEYDEVKLAQKHISHVTLDEEDDFTAERLAALEREYRPDVVAIEYNGMWSQTLPVEITYPQGWQLAEVMTTVDSTTFDMYTKNDLRAFMIEEYKITDIVVFNRFTDDDKRIAYRSIVKAANMNAQVVFEYTDGRIDAQFDASPFDLTQDEVKVDDGDFGVFYFDIMDHVAAYAGKTVEFRALCVKINAMRMPGFLVGRFAMTCCANDIQFISIYAKNDKAFKNRAWYHVRAKVVPIDASVYGEAAGEQLPALEVLSLTPAEAPEQEVVTF